jgi:hypothetical protein
MHQRGETMAQTLEIAGPAYHLSKETGPCQSPAGAGRCDARIAHSRRRIDLATRSESSGARSGSGAPWRRSLSAAAARLRQAESRDSSPSDRPCPGTRAPGPHVVRPFANGSGVGTDASADALVLRDLIASSRGGLRSRSQIASAAGRSRACSRGTSRGTGAIGGTPGGRPSGVGPAPAEIDRVSAGPPPVLQPMLEAQP